MPYPKLKLVDHIPANLASILIVEDGVEEPMLQMPFALRIKGGDEAFIILVCDNDENGFYGYTLTYYQRKGNGWYRWLIERPDLPRESRWQRADEPFTGLDFAIGYEERLAKILPGLNDEDIETVRSNSPFNGGETLPFGKYAGCTVRSILDRGDFGYIRWAWENKPELRYYFISETTIDNFKEDNDENEAGKEAGIAE